LKRRSLEADRASGRKKKSVNRTGPRQRSDRARKKKVRDHQREVRRRGNMKVARSTAKRGALPFE